MNSICNIRGPKLRRILRHPGNRPGKRLLRVTRVMARVSACCGSSPHSTASCPTGSVRQHPVGNRSIRQHPHRRCTSASVHHRRCTECSAASTPSAAVGIRTARSPDPPAVRAVPSAASPKVTSPLRSGAGPAQPRVCLRAPPELTPQLQACPASR